MTIFRERPVLAWVLLAIALLALFSSYYFFMRPAEPVAVPAAGGQPPSAAPSTEQSGALPGQTVPY